MASIGIDDLLRHSFPNSTPRSKLANSPPWSWRAPSPSGCSSSARATTRSPCRCPRRPCASAKVSTRNSSAQRYRGLLQGIPYGVKDLLAFAGQPTTWGAKPYAGQVFDYNATVIDKLAGAGAVLTGKLAMVELAGGGGYRFPSASFTGPGLNPWDRTRWSGGSSSGSGAAVAAGLVPFAIGSETSGSIVTPASFCGVTALRPTYGLVSRYGAMALSWTLDKLGPFAAPPRIAA